MKEFLYWWNTTNQGLAIVGIALGIIAKYFYEYTIKYLQARNKASVRFDWKGFGLTVLLSGFLAIIMYSGLLSAVFRTEKKFDGSSPPNYQINQDGLRKLILILTRQIRPLTANRFPMSHSNYFVLSFDPFHYHR